MIFSIGSHSGKDIVVNEPSVSRDHAEIDYGKDELILLKDLDSQNGCYVNDRRIRTAVINMEDDVRIGKHKLNIESTIQKCAELFKERKTDYNEEYQTVMKVFKEFQDKKDKLIDKPKMAIYIRLGMMGLLAIAWLIGGLQFSSIYTYCIIGLAVITVLSGLLGPSPVERNQKMDLLKLEYEDLLQCPKCSAKMINQGYTYWQGKKGCNNEKCNAVYQ